MRKVADVFLWTHLSVSIDALTWNQCCQYVITVATVVNVLTVITVVNVTAVANVVHK